MSEEKGKLGQEDLSEITFEQKRELIKKALEEGSEEAKFLLQLKEWRRPGDDFDDYAEIKVLHGEIERVLIDHYYNYPTHNEFLYVIIPKTRSVVLLHESEDNYEGKLQEHQTLYVFAYPDGWKSLHLY